MLLKFMIWSVCFHSTQTQEGQIWGNFYSKMSEEAQAFPIDQIKDRELKLQLISLQDKGSGALSPEKAAHVRQSLHVSFHTVVDMCLNVSLTIFYNLLKSAHSWVRPWVRWVQSTARQLCASRTTHLTARLWSQVNSVNKGRLCWRGCLLLSATVR